MCSPDVRDTRRNKELVLLLYKTKEKVDKKNKRKSRCTFGASLWRFDNYLFIYLCENHVLHQHHQQRIRKRRRTVKKMDLHERPFGDSKLLTAKK